MNWSKIKTIMICFLFAMNVFMISFIGFSIFRDHSVPDEVVEASLRLLKKDGFECKKETLPNLTYKLPTLNTQFYSESELSEIFFSVQMAFKTTQNSLVASGPDGTLTVSENYFLFENGNTADTSASSGKIKKALKKAGIDMSNSVYDEKERCFYYMYNGVNLFNMYLKAELDQDGNLCYVSALWPGKISPQKDTSLSFSSSVKKVKTAFPQGGKIELIEPGYSLIPMGGNRYIFQPSWRVKVGEELKILE